MKKSQNPNLEILKLVVEQLGELKDVMPTNSEILGFGNDWYVPAMKNAETVQISSGIDIQRVSAPYFLITKLEAFKGRGNNDFMLSHDIEDIISVIDGRPELLEEIQNGDLSLIEALAAWFSKLLRNERFVEAIPGHLLPDEASQARLPIIMDRITKITNLKSN